MTIIYAIYLVVVHYGMTAAVVFADQHVTAFRRLFQLFIPFGCCIQLYSPYPDGRQLYLNTYAIDLLPTLEALSSQHPRHNSSRAHTSGCERQDHAAPEAGPPAMILRNQLGFSSNALSIRSHPCRPVFHYLLRPPLVCSCSFASSHDPFPVFAWSIVALVHS